MLTTAAVVGVALDLDGGELRVAQDHVRDLFHEAEALLEDLVAVGREVDLTADDDGARGDLHQRATRAAQQRDLGAGGLARSHRELGQLDEVVVRLDAHRVDTGRHAVQAEGARGVAHEAVRRGAAQLHAGPADGAVFVDDTTVACAAPASEIPVWLRVAVEWISVILLARFLARSRPNLTARPRGVPKDWIAKPSKNGGGTRWVDPKNPHHSVRVMPGDPNSPYPNSRQPYVRITRDGQSVDVSGNVVPKNTPDAHIPFKDFQGSPKPGYPIFPQRYSPSTDTANPICSPSDGDCGED